MTQINADIIIGGNRENIGFGEFAAGLRDAGYTFGGEITPTSTPSPTEQSLFFAAMTAGTYTNYGNIVVAAGEIAFIYKENGSWVKVSKTFATPEQGELADSAYQKPDDGIPSTDMTEAVQTSLGKADTAIQSVAVGTTTTGEEGTDASVTNSGTPTNPVFDFTIPRGDSAVNPFKGWFEAGATETSNLPANPSVGDYAYVMTVDGEDNPITKVYDCVSAGVWHDSGRTVDTSNVQTFETSQQVNEVSIVNDLETGGINDVLAAEQGKVLKQEVSQLDQELNGEFGYVEQSVTMFEDWYYAYNSSSNTMSQVASQRDGTNCFIVECLPGDRFKLFGKGTNTVKLYAFTDVNRVVLLTNTENVDWRLSGGEITAPNSAAKLYVNFLNYDELTDNIQKWGIVQEGAKQDVDALDTRVSTLESDIQSTLKQDDVVDNLITNNAGKPLSAKQGKVLNEQIHGEFGYVDQSVTLLQDCYYGIAGGKIKFNTTERIGTNCCVIDCNPGDKFKIYGRGTSNIPLYAFTSADNTILLQNTVTTDWRTEGGEVTAPNGTAKLYCNFEPYDSGNKIQKYEIVNEGVEQRLDEIEQQLQTISPVYSGKKFIAFGDSITEFKWDVSMGGDGKGWVDHASEILLCEFVNVAIGGAHMNVRANVEVFDESHNYATDNYVYHRDLIDNLVHIYRCTSNHTGAWNSADFEDVSENQTIMGGVAYYPLWVYSMIKAFCDVATIDPNERFKNQIAAAECVYTWKTSHDDNRAIIQTLVNTDPNDIDAIIILHGANDYATYGYWGVSGSYDVTTLLGAINQSVKELNSVFKSKPVFYVTPPVRWFGYSDGEGEVENFSDYYKKDENAPKTYKGFVYEILANEYKLNHIPVCDLYGELQWTMWNFSNYFPSNDGTHPRPGFKNIGQKISSFLIANKNF